MHVFHPKALRLRRVPIHLIQPSPWPLRYDSEEDLTEMARSLQCTGLIQPPVVRRVGRTYELIAGNRRLAAAKSLGWERIPVLVVRADSTAAVNMATAENLARRDLTPAEEKAARTRLGRLLKRTLREEAAFAHSLRRPSLRPKESASDPPSRGSAAGRSKERDPDHTARRRQTSAAENSYSLGASGKSPRGNAIPWVGEAPLWDRPAPSTNRPSPKSDKKARKTPVFPEDSDLFTKDGREEPPQELRSARGENAPSFPSATEESPVESTPVRRGVVRESALFIRSAERLLAGLRECGLGEECDRTEEGESLLYTLRIPK